MKQIELTSKLVLAILGLTSVSAIIVPTYATTIPNNTTSFDDIENGQIPSEEDIRNSVTGAIAGAIQNIHIVQVISNGVTIPPGSTGTTDAVCPDEALNVVGGGFSASPPENIKVYDNFPANVFTWRVSGVNENPSGGEDVSLVSIALCLVVSE